jgi:5-formyltetrahydrofolate cyclo-ligase
MRQPYDAGMARDPEKVARRAELRARRRAIASPRRVDDDGPRIATRALGLLDELGLGAGGVVTSYVAVPGEPPTAAHNAALTAAGIRVLVPITLPDLDLDWRDADDDSAPPLGVDAVSLADVVLAPGLAVDRAGTRMGQGGGCYDRALPRRRPGTAVVVVLHPGELLEPDEPALPRQPHDQPVDAVLTADEVVDLGVSPWRSLPPAAG